MDPKGKGMVVNNKEKESLFNEPRDDKPTDSGSSHKKKDGKKKRRIKKIVVGAKAKTPPFARCLRRPRCTNGGKTTGRLTLRPTRRRTKTCDEVVSSYDLVQHGGPHVIRPIVIGPAWTLRITGLICKGLPVITVCNPALWEYFGDNLGA
jgi:hypothetical protein